MNSFLNFFLLDFLRFLTSFQFCPTVNHSAALFVLTFVTHIYSATGMYLKQMKYIIIIINYAVLLLVMKTIQLVSVN